MSQTKTAISIDKTLFARGEAIARELQVTRSALYALALEQFIKRREQEQLTEQLNAVYDGTSDPEDMVVLQAMRERRRLLAADDPWT